MLLSANFGGDALLWAMNYDVYGKPLAGVMTQVPWLLRLICIGTLLLEIVGPVLLFIPFGTRWTRLFLIGCFAALHIGIELTLHVGMFSWVSLAAWAALLPAMFWDNRWLTRLSPAEALTSVQREVRPSSTWWRWTTFITCQAIPSTVCAVLIVITITWNLSYSFSSKKVNETDDISPRESVQRPIRRVVNATMLRQRWNMFGKPTEVESWLVFRAELTNGDVVDLFHNGQPVSMEKPPDLSSTFNNHRWRKLQVLLSSTQWRWRKHREPVAEFLCRRWNESHDEDHQVVRLELYRLTEKKEAPMECTSKHCLTITPDPVKPAPPEGDGTTAPDLAATQR